MPDLKPAKPRLPPRWFIRLAWIIHRRLYGWTGGRLGLWRPKPGGWGALRLTTTGRRTGRARPVIVGYVEDGPNLVTWLALPARFPSAASALPSSGAPSGGR